MLQIIRTEKVDEKNGVICLIFKKLKSVEATYIYASESSH